MATTRRYPFFDPARTIRLHGGSLPARYPASGTSVGHHTSRQRGWSTEFAEHRPYVPGDDLRHLDWKVYGRSDKRYVRQYDDERTRNVYLVADHSRSMAYCGADAATVSAWASHRRPSAAITASPSLTSIDKLSWSRSCLAYLAWVALDRTDPTTLIPLADQLGSHYPPSAHPAHFYRLLDQLAKLSPGGGTSLARACHLLAHRLRPTGLVIIVSDFLTDLESLIGGLHRLQAAGHDVWLIQTLDRTEWDFPFDRPAIFAGLEGEPAIRLTSSRAGDHYRRSIQQFCGRLAAWTNQRQIRYCRAFTDVEASDVVGELVHSDGMRRDFVAQPSSAVRPLTTAQALPAAQPSSTAQTTEKDEAAR